MDKKSQNTSTHCVLMFSNVDFLFYFVIHYLEQIELDLIMHTY